MKVLEKEIGRERERERRFRSPLLRMRKSEKEDY